MSRNPESSEQDQLTIETSSSRKAVGRKLDRKLEDYRVTATATLQKSNVAAKKPRQWATFSSALSAAIALPVAAEATVIYNGPQDLRVPVVAGTAGGYATSRGTLQLDLDGDDVFDAAISGYFDGYYGFVRWLGGPNAQVAIATSVYPNYLSNARAFPSGATIGASQTFRTNRVIRGASAYAFSWGDSQSDGIIGFQVDGHYGWLRIDLERYEIDARIVDWAYESVPGQAIAAGSTTGTIPEPDAGALTGLSLLALGIRGVRAKRQRRASRRDM